MKAFLTVLSLFAFTGMVSAKVTVNGSGKIVYIPDLGHISVGVSAEGKTAAEAWENNKRKVEKIFESLKKLGLEPRDYQTTSLNISPKYHHVEKKQPELIGYIVSYELKVTVRKLDQMGAILDEVVQAGANRNMSLSFGCSDYERYLDEARTKAIADARKKANLYATGAGSRLGKVLVISENLYNPSRILSYEHAIPAGGKSMMVAVGEQEMSVQLHVEYELLEPLES